jgi:DNA-binding CsgD family transcriptional regulator
MLRRASATRQSEDPQQAAQIAEEAVRIAQGRGDDTGELLAQIELGQAMLNAPMGESYSPPAHDIDIEGASKAYERAWELASKLEDLPLMAAIRREQGVVEVGRVRAFIQAMVDESPDILKDPNLDPHQVPEIVAGFERFRQLAGEAVEMFEKLGDQRGVMSSLIAYAYANIIEDTTRGHAGRVEQIRRLRRNLKRLTSESERAQSEAYMLYSIHVYARGHGPADLELARGIETYEAARAIGLSSLELLAAGGVALAYAGLGDIAEADRWLDKAGTAALSSTAALPERQLETWRGLVRAAAGDSAGMRAHLERALTLASDHGSPAGRCELLALLAAGSARLGADAADQDLLARAEEWATETIRMARALPSSDAPWLGIGEAALAQVAVARGDADAAVEHGLASIAELRRTRQMFTFLHPEWRLLSARSLAGLEDPLVAEFHAHAIRDIQMALHETVDDAVRGKWLRSPVIRELVERLGLGQAVRVEQSGAVVPAGLSERQVIVLGQVMAGQTNAEIAASLGMSESEAAAELDEVYEALGVRTRAQASVAALREGIA